MRISIWFLFFLVQLILSSDCRGQSIEYEELGTIPLTGIQNVFVAPYGGIFVRSGDNIYRSNDDGITWSESIDFPVGFETRSIDFFADGIAVFSESPYPIIDKQSLVFRDGDFRSLIPDDMQGGIYKVIGNSLFYYRSDSIFISKDKGTNFEGFKLEKEHEGVSDIHSYGDKVFVFSYDTDSITQKRVYALEEYDRNLNFVAGRILPVELGDSFFKLDANGNNILFYEVYGRSLYYSNDDGKTFVYRELDYTLRNFSILNNSYIINSADTIYSLELGDNFLINPVIPIDTLGYFEYYNTALSPVKFRGNLLSIRGDSYIKIRNLLSGNEIGVYSFPFKNAEIEKIRIDSEDVIYASTKNFLLKSKNYGVTWEEVYGSDASRIYSWTLSNDGGFAIGMVTRNQFYNLGDVSNLYISSEGDIEIWDDRFSHYQSFSLDNNRLYVGGGNCSDLGNSLYYSSYGSIFKHQFTSPLDCWSGNMEAVLHNNKIYLFSYDVFSEGIYHSIDLLNDLKVDNPKGLTPTGQNLKYYSKINNLGELFVYPKNSSGVEDDQRYPVYYSPNISELDIEPVGRAPQGRLVQTDNNDRAFILQSDGTHYVRSDYAIDYDKVEVKNKSFETFIDGDFDSQNRLVIAVENGRILRAVTDGITTSTEEVENVGFTLSPNPSSQVLHISISDGESSTITISDISGRIVSVSQHQKLKLNIDIAELTNGIYFLTFQNESGSKGTRKFVKM